MHQRCVGDSQNARDDNVSTRLASPTKPVKLVELCFWKLIRDEQRRIQRHGQEAAGPERTTAAGAARPAASLCRRCAGVALAIVALC